MPADEEPTPRKVPAAEVGEVAGFVVRIIVDNLFQDVGGQAVYLRVAYKLLQGHEVFYVEIGGEIGGGDLTIIVVGIFGGRAGVRRHR